MKERFFISLLLVAITFFCVCDVVHAQEEYPPPLNPEEQVVYMTQSIVPLSFESGTMELWFLGGDADYSEFVWRLVGTINRWQRVRILDGLRYILPYTPVRVEVKPCYEGSSDCRMMIVKCPVP